MRAGLTAILMALLLGTLGGCAYSTRSGMPAHIQTIEVPMFGNDTFYKGLEGRLTRRIIEKLNQDPNVRVVNRGGDGVLTGDIIDVRKEVVRETSDDRPASVKLTIVVRFTFEDMIERRALIKDKVIHSQRDSAGAGIYDVDRGEARVSAENAAAEELADEIVRETAGMW